MLLHLNELVRKGFENWIPDDPAYAVGLGSCWIHRCKEMFEGPEGKALLQKWGLPENVKGVASIALGYADCLHPDAAPRKEGITLKV